jgi:hypothetical protein
MIIQIDTESIREKQYSLEQVLLMLFFNCESNSAQIIDSLIKRNIIKRASIQDITKNGIKYKLTLEGKSVMESCIVMSNVLRNVELEDERIDKLAEQLKNIFPKGKKDGTNLYWAEGKTFIKKRLKNFFSKYGNEYTDEQIINATKAYVSSFNGNYKIMRVLKYFIYKEEKGIDGKINSTSDLVNTIENADQENLDTDWTSREI